MNVYYNRHYVLVDPQNCITFGWSDGLDSNHDVSKAICINEQGSYQFRLFPDGEDNPRLLTLDGIPLYKWDSENHKVLKRTNEEIENDRQALPKPKPSAQEQMRADIDFLAALQGIVL